MKYPRRQLSGLTVLNIGSIFLVLLAMNTDNSSVFL